MSKNSSKNTNLTQKEIEHLSRLANLPLSKKEKIRFSKQLTSVISYVGEVQKILTKDTPPTNQVTGKTNEFRKDLVEKSITQDQALSQAKNTYQGYFLVPHVFSDEN